MSCRTVHCTHCEQDLPVEAFPHHRITPGTRNDRCRKCRVVLARNFPSKVGAVRAEKRKKYRAVEAAGRAVWGQKNKAHLAEYMRGWREKNRGIVNERSARGDLKIAIRGGVIPAWADRAKMREIYAEASRLTKETGVPHHVDHVIPLKGRTVCGLHVETNLQILTAQANLAKRNKLMEAAY